MNPTDVIVLKNDVKVAQCISSPFDSPICHIYEPRNVWYYEVFLLICVQQLFQKKSSLVATLATLSILCNLHKSKMAARRHFEKSTS